MNFRGSIAFIGVFCVAGALFAKTDESRWCGTKGVARTQYMLKMHEQRKEKPAGIQAAMPHINTDIGEIAVIEGTDSTIVTPNPFDISGKKVIITEPSSGVYNMKIRNGSVSGTQGSSITLGDDDSLKVDFTSGFAFPFYGTTYTSVFINSDGNLTFTEKDDASSPRDVFRTLEGPPRVAGFFSDLDPSSKGEVKVLQSSTKFRVTWKDVTEFGGSNSNTFQITLFKNGNIQIVFGQTVETGAAIVGISPGNTSPGDSTFVDFSETGPVKGFSNAILERFATERDLDYIALIQEFHDTHPQIFDLVTIFTDSRYLQGSGAFAFFSSIQNHDEGIGLPIFDFSEFFGSDKIQGFLMMESIVKYPADVNTDFLGTNNTLDIMGQETGHRWMAYPRAVISGVPSTEILGRDLSHWNFFLDSDASDMEGNDWQDNGNGTFTTIAATEQFSKLDRYLMGLIPPSQVPPFFLVRAAGNPGDAPAVGVTVTGTRVDVTVDDVIAAEGARNPSSAASQKKWKQAFIYFIEPGTNPDPARLAQVDLIRRKWQSYFRAATGRKGKITTKLP